MRKYNLGFFADKDIYEHVRNTVMQYRRSINLKEFNKNIIDPIKLTFDSKIYKQTIEETIKSECIRQIDKTNNNRIGYFHQHIFRYAGGGWEVPANGSKGGFDVINEEKHIYVEMKNKHNTMNSASTSATYLKTWRVTVDGEQFNNSRVRRVSIDKFYEMVFGDKEAFLKLCKTLPQILDDILKDEPKIAMDYAVYDEIDKTDFYKSLYLLAFNTYEGFDRF